MRKRVNQLIASRTGQTLEKIQADTERDFWMSAEQAVAYGIVSKVIERASEV